MSRYVKPWKLTKVNFFLKAMTLCIFDCILCLIRAKVWNTDCHGWFSDCSPKVTNNPNLKQKSKWMRAYPACNQKQIFDTTTEAGSSHHLCQPTAAWWYSKRLRMLRMLDCSVGRLKSQSEYASRRSWWSRQAKHTCISYMLVYPIMASDLMGVTRA